MCHKKSPWVSSGSSFAEASLNDSTSWNVDWTRTGKRDHFASVACAEFGQPHPRSVGHRSSSRESPGHQLRSRSSELDERSFDSLRDRWPGHHGQRNAGMDALDWFSVRQLEAAVVARCGVWLCESRHDRRDDRVGQDLTGSKLRRHFLPQRVSGCVFGQKWQRRISARYADGSSTVRAVRREWLAIAPSFRPPSTGSTLSFSKKKRTLGRGAFFFCIWRACYRVKKDSPARRPIVLDPPPLKP